MSVCLNFSQPSQYRRQAPWHRSRRHSLADKVCAAGDAGTAPRRQPTV